MVINLILLIWMLSIKPPKPITKTIITTKTSTKGTVNKSQFKNMKIIKNDDGSSQTTLINGYYLYASAWSDYKASGLKHRDLKCRNNRLKMFQLVTAILVMFYHLPNRVHIPPNHARGMVLLHHMIAKIVLLINAIIISVVIKIKTNVNWYAKIILILIIILQKLDVIVRKIILVGMDMNVKMTEKIVLKKLIKSLFLKIHSIFLVHTN